MKPIVTLLFLLIATPALCQQFNFPVFKPTVVSLKSMVPTNWKIKLQAIGDLNGDKFADLALILEYSDKIKEHRPDSYTNTRHPRMLLIWFKTVNGYQLALQNNTIISREGEGGMVNDPLDNIKITNKVLHINYEYVRSHAYYKYRYQNDGFYLIGATEGGVSGGKIKVCDYNFSTRKAECTYGELGKDTDKKETKRIKLTKLNALTDPDLPNGWDTYEVTCVQ
ncbi:hypothetical protein ACFQ3S_15315 [Mucilaginibacter terrae]|uniref:hypothetical protein n=1 Tax=Mucilaginibacter terrae TaxID=1955052 RepID=UPI00363F2C1D